LLRGSDGGDFFVWGDTSSLTGHSITSPVALKSPNSDVKSVSGKAGSPSSAQTTLSTAQLFGRVASLPLNDSKVVHAACTRAQLFAVTSTLRFARAVSPYARLIVLCPVVCSVWFTVSMEY
jgi:hypothetical protein